MPPIHVVIAKTSSGMYWDSMEKLLESEPDLLPQPIQYDWTLKSTLRQQQPQVLILEKTEKSNSREYQDYLEAVPNMSIIVLDPMSTETLVSLHNIGSRQLLELIKALSKGADAKVIQFPPSHKTKTPSPAPPPEPTHLPKQAHALFAPYQNGQAYLRDICQWLDLLCLQLLAQENDSGNQFSAPGWAMNADQARALLGGEFMATDEDTLETTRLELESRMAQREAAPQTGVGHIKLLWVFQQFQLDLVEQRIFLLVFAPELDAKYAAVFGYLNDNLTRRWPTPTLLARLLHVSGLEFDPLAVQQLIGSQGALAEHGLIEPENDDLLSNSDKLLKPAREILAYLLNSPLTTHIAGTSLELHTAAAHPHETQLHKLWDNNDEDNTLPVLQVGGGSHAATWFRKLASKSGHAMLVLHLAHLPEADKNLLMNVMASAARLARLHDAALLVTGLDAPTGGNLPEWLQSLLVTYLKGKVPRLAVCSETLLNLPPTLSLIRVSRRDYDLPECSHAWSQLADKAGIHLTSEQTYELATIFRFDETDIEKTLRLYAPVKGHNLEADLTLIKKNACLVARGELPSAIKLVKAEYQWGDIVLPAATQDKLARIPTHIRFADKVFEEWGFKQRLPYGRGVAALFSGVSGTGKTMAAQIIASDLGVDLLQVDLAKTVSKYIGETEKNLDAIFSAAERACAVLLFDEADAIFGKRTEVRDAHDRYANVETAYLLQRIESFTGLVILTTNFRQNLDAAFLRRMRFVINFEAPAANERLKIWQKVFPGYPAEHCGQQQQQADKPGLLEGVDFQFLAKRLELTGGNIQQIALRAAFTAAAEHCGSIQMRHVLSAIREEAQKLGMSNIEKTLELIAA